MKAFSSLKSLATAVFRRSRVEREMDEELRAHIANRADDLVRSGLMRDEAMRRARMEFGGYQKYKEEVRESLGAHFIETLLQDVRYALRTLRKSPGFTTVAVLTLALGIGANTAIFSAIQTALLRPYPFYQPDRLVDLWSADTRHHSRDGISGPDYLDYKSQGRSFKELCSYTFRQPADLSIGEHSQRVWAMLSTGSLFATLGIQPLLGRPFLPSEESSASRAVMLSYALWQSRFAGNPNALGQTIVVDGRLREIVGVLPPHFDLPEEVGSPIGVVLPIPWDSAVFRNRTLTNLLGIARLPSNVNLSLAQTDLSVIAARLAAAHPASNRDRGVQVVPISEEHDSLQNPLWALFGAVSFVLLIACGNVSGLLLARGLARRKEFAVRAALGASRGRLIRQTLTESLLIALVGGALGLAGAWELSGVLSKMGAATIPALNGLRTDISVVVFAFVASLAVTAIFGLLPALKISAFDVNSSLKGSPSADPLAFRPAQLRGFLVGVQVALAVVVLCGAGILLRSLGQLSSTSPGFNVNHLLTADVSKSATPSAQLAFYDQLLARMSSIPGVLDAAATSAPPLGSDAIAPMPPFDVPSAHSGSRSFAMVRIITPGYFQVMGVHILAGRGFSAQDSFAAPRVAIINEWVARNYFKNGRAVGQDVIFYPVPYRSRFAPQPGAVRVVGVIADVQHWFTGGMPHVDSEIYLPYAQAPVADMMLIARVDGRTPAVAHELQTRITALDPSALLDDPQTMRDQFSETLAPNRFYPALLSVFALIALVLASIGIYGVVSYWVRERTQEIGIRLALGARSLDVASLVIKQGLIFVLAGAVAGLAAAFALTRFLSTLLYGVKPRDPATFVAVAVLLLAVALAACYIPARRAMKVDPMIALRYE